MSIWDDSFFDRNISSVRFVAWDTETTGATPANDYLVELAAIAFDEEIDEHRSFQALIRPPINIPENVIAIHGITNEMVAVSPPASQALEDFSEFLSWSGSPRILLAHNASFDVGMVVSEWQRGGKPVTGTPELVIDTCGLARCLLPQLKSHGLAGLAVYFGIDHLKAHRALEDVKVLRSVFLKLLGLAADRVTSRFTVGSLIDLCGGYFILDPSNKKNWQKPFVLPPRIAQLEMLCGTNTKVGISYISDEHGLHGLIDEYRYITPLSIHVRKNKTYVVAFCHRDQIEKTFRADRIVSIKVEVA